MSDRFCLRERIRDDAAVEVIRASDPEVRSLICDQCVVRYKEHTSRMPLGVVEASGKLAMFDLSDRFGNRGKYHPFVGVHEPAQPGEVDDNRARRHDYRSARAVWRWVKTWLFAEPSMPRLRLGPNGLGLI